MNVDLRARLAQGVWEQGERPTCAVITVTGAHEGSRGDLPVVPLAPEALWNYCTSRGLTGPDGVLVADVATALAAQGQPPLAAWSYDTSLGHGTCEPPVDLEAPPWLRADLEEFDLEHDGAEARLQAELSDGRAVVLTIELTDEFDYVSGSGIIQVPPLTAPSGGYHTVLVVGLLDLPSPYLLVKNSWGVEWGLGGYAFLPMGYLVNFAVEAHSIQATRDSADNRHEIPESV